MKLLNDEMLVGYVGRPDPLLIKGLHQPPDWFGKDSPVQPSSVDLQIGLIFLPGTEHGMDGSEDKPLTSHSLKPGQTAVITTLETLGSSEEIVGVLRFGQLAK